MMFADVNHVEPGPRLSDPDKARLLKMVRAAYPFGQREHFPYKMWLSEIRRFKDYLEGKSVCRHGPYKPGRTGAADPSQGCLL